VIAVQQTVEPGQFVTFLLDNGEYMVVVICSIEGAYAYPLQITEDVATTYMSGTVRLNFTGWELLRK